MRFVHHQFNLTTLGSNRRKPYNQLDIYIKFNLQPVLLIVLCCATATRCQPNCS